MSKQTEAQSPLLVQEQWLQAVTTKIEAALLSHRLSLRNDVDDDGVGFPLVDALCCRQTSLDIGKREVEDIVEAIYHVLDANIPPALAAQPEQERTTHITWDERGVRTVNGVPDDAKRPWVDLGDSQIEQVYYDVAKLHRGAAMPWGQVQFGKALQALIKEKNT